MIHEQYYEEEYYEEEYYEEEYHEEEEEIEYRSDYERRWWDYGYYEDARFL